MDLQLKGKKAIVTGATKGIGLATATQLAVEGADVAICARTKEDVDRVVETLSKSGSNASGAAVDLYDMDAYLKWLEQTANDMGGEDDVEPTPPKLAPTLPSSDQSS